MIKAEFFVSASGDITGFCINGHAKFSYSGTDVVCAAISSAAYMTANTLTDVIHAEVSADVNERLGHMQLTVEAKDVHRCSDLLLGFKMHLCMLEEIYPKNIKVSYVEV